MPAPVTAASQGPAEHLAAQLPGVDALAPLWFALVRRNSGNRRIALRVVR